jgi:hypothetical protein
MLPTLMISHGVCQKDLQGSHGQRNAMAEELQSPLWPQLKHKQRKPISLVKCHEQG